MSEYNKFLKQFNKQLGVEDDSSLSEREDIIPIKTAVVSEAEAVKEEAASDVAEAEKTIADEVLIAAEKRSEAEIPSDVSEESMDSIPKSRFIKTSDVEFISVSSKNSDSPTAATKYTDRLLPVIPEKKSSLTEAPRTNTYIENHSPKDSERKIVPLTEEERDEAKSFRPENRTPSETARSQTRIIPTVISDEDTAELHPDVIVEKIPVDEENGETKPLVAKGKLLREIAKTSDGLIEDENQMRMDGFGEEDNTGIPDITDDAALREELSKVREKRINSFRFWTKSATETGESNDKSFAPRREERRLPGFLLDIRKKFEHLDTDFTPVGEEEYQDPSRRKEIFSRLIEARKSTIIKAFIVGVIGIVLLMINVFTGLSAQMNNGFFSLFGGSAVAYNIINLVCLLVAGVLVADELKKGIFSILKVRPKTDSALLLMYAGALAQNIAAFFTILRPESEYHMLTGAVITLSAFVLVAKAFYFDSTRHCFKAVGTVSDKSYLRKISDEKLISQLLKEKDTTETNVVYAGKTRFISNFLKRSASAAFAGQVSSRVVIISGIASLIAGIIGIFATHSPVYAFGCFTLTAAFSFPVSCLLFTGYAIATENNALSVKASFVGSYIDAYSFYCIDDIILNGEDIFSAEVVSSECSRSVSSRQAQFCAAVITNKAGGLLGKAFSVFSQGLEEHYPEVEGLSVEDKLGLSAWISDCRVLLGTKQFLANHNVELPEENTVPFVLGENTKPLFLAIEGHFAAVFAVKYSCHKTTAKSLRSLAYNGANILISIMDPNINEEFGEELLGLPAESLRVMKKDANEDFIKNKATVTDSEDTGIVFSDSFDAFARTIEGAIKLEKFRRVAKTLCEAVSIAGMLLGILLSATGALTLMSGWPVVFIQVCMTLISFVVTPLMAASTIKKKAAAAVGSTADRRVNTSAEEKELFDMYERASEEDSDDTEEADEEEEIIDEDDEITEAYSSEKNNTADRIRKILRSSDKKAKKQNPEETGEQMMMEGAPYTEPPEIIDFSKIEEEGSEKAHSSVTDEMLDLFADDGEASRAKTRQTSAPAKTGLFSRLGFGSGADSDDNEEIVNEDKKPSGILSVFAREEKIAPPPRFDLSKKDEAADPLDATFEPPETEAPTALYKDDFFSSFDTEEDDKAFADIRRRRKETEEDGAGEFDFWTKK